MKKQFYAISVLFFILSSSVVFGQMKVKAVGTAGIHKNFISIARDRAIDNAKRQAVEQSSRIFIQNETLVENYAVVYDRIYSKYSGYINNYKILEEKRKGDELFVTIEAEVGTAKLKEDLESILKSVLTEKSNPRLMILFNKRSQNDFMAETAMTEYFLSMGFKVVDAGVIRNNTSTKKLQALGRDKGIARQMGQRYGAEIIIIGSVIATSHPFKVGSVEMHTNQATISAKVIKSDTGDIMASGSKEHRLPGNKEMFKDPIEKAAQTLGEDLTEKAVKWWQKELSSSTTVLLVVKGLGSYGEVNKLKAKLPNEARGIQRLNQRYFGEGRLELDVQLRGKIHFLANDIVNFRLNGKSFAVVRESQNMLVVKAR